MIDREMLDANIRIKLGMRNTYIYTIIDKHFMCIICKKSYVDKPPSRMCCGFSFDHTYDVVDVKTCMPDLLL